MGREVSPRKAPPAAADLIASTLQGHRAQAEADRLRTQNKALLAKLAIAEDRAGIAEALKASAKAPKPIKAKKQELLHKRVATPVFLVSDLHVEETVDPKTVGGLNAYDLTEADRRLEKLGDSMLWMMEHHRASFEIREAVLWLGGDLLSGYIHPDLVEVAALSPVQTILWLQERIERLINKLLSLGGLERIIIPCNVGNHGRTTVRMQVATVTENSYEWLLYQQLRRTFATNSRVEFHIADGDFLRLKVHDTRLGFHHGHATRFGGGVGGITIPILKSIAKWNTYGECDVWNLGHWHQVHDLPRFVVNGSLIGTSPYGMQVGAFEAPAQASYLIDSKRGKAMSTTLWVADAARGKVR